MHLNLLFLAFPLLYLDPGSGSFLIQLLLAVGLGLSVAVKMYWAKIKSIFTGNRGTEQTKPTAGDDQDED